MEETRTYRKQDQVYINITHGPKTKRKPEKLIKHV